MTAPDLPDWWGNEQTTSPHPPPTTLLTATLAGVVGTAELIPLPPAQHGIRLWAVSAYVERTAGAGGYIDAPIGNEHIICAAGQSLNLRFDPSGILDFGSNMVVDTVGTIIYAITAVYDLTL